MNIQYICKNLYNLTQIPMYHYEDNTVVGVYENMSVPKRLDNIILSNRTLVLDNIKENTIARLKDMSEISYFGFVVDNNQFVFGPFLEQEITNESINNLKKRLKIIGEDSVLIDHFYDSVKLVNSYEIDFLYSVISNLITDNTSTLEYREVEPQKVDTSQKEVIESQFDEQEYVSKNYVAEDEFLRIIESGDIKEAKTFFTNRIMVSLPKRAPNDTLRNSKTRLTILNTLSNRAAIKGGIDVQLGHQISTNYGIRIESMKSIFDSDALTREIIVAYTESVKNYSLKGYSKLVKEAILHIRRNITSNYNLVDLANDLFVTKEHLARQFKKETETTVSKYIRKSKITESKKLLSRTSQSIINISSMLGFSNSSHFSKVFSEIEGISPMEYRRSK